MGWKVELPGIATWAWASRPKTIGEQAAPPSAVSFAAPLARFILLATLAAVLFVVLIQQDFSGIGRALALDLKHHPL